MTEDISTIKGINSIHENSNSFDTSAVNNLESNVPHCNKLNGDISCQSASAITCDSFNDKKSFHITSVTVQNNLSTDGNADESADESRKEDLSDNIDMSAADIQADITRSTENVIRKDDVLYKVTSVGSAPIIPTSAQYGIAVVSNPNSDLSDNVNKLVTNDKLNDFATKNECLQNGLENNYGNNTSNNLISKDYNTKNERFKVVKIESNEPFKRGRWVCMDFLDQSMDQAKKSVISSDHDKCNRKEIDKETVTSDVIVNGVISGENMTSNNDKYHKVVNEIENKAATLTQRGDSPNQANGEVSNSVSPNQTFNTPFVPPANVTQSQPQSLTQIVIPQGAQPAVASGSYGHSQSLPQSELQHAHQTAAPQQSLHTVSSLQQSFHPHNSMQQTQGLLPQGNCPVSNIQHHPVQQQQQPVLPQYQPLQPSNINQNAQMRIQPSTQPQQSVSTQMQQIPNHCMPQMTPSQVNQPMASSTNNETLMTTQQQTTQSVQQQGNPQSISQQFQQNQLSGQQPLQHAIQPIPIQQQQSFQHQSGQQPAPQQIMHSNIQQLPSQHHLQQQPNQQTVQSLPSQQQPPAQLSNMPQPALQQNIPHLSSQQSVTQPVVQSTVPFLPQQQSVIQQPTSQTTTQQVLSQPVQQQPQQIMQQQLQTNSDQQIHIQPLHQPSQQQMMSQQIQSQIPQQQQQQSQQPQMQQNQQQIPPHQQQMQHIPQQTIPQQQMSAVPQHSQQSQQVSQPQQISQSQQTQQQIQLQQQQQQQQQQLQQQSQNTQPQMPQHHQNLLQQVPQQQPQQMMQNQIPQTQNIQSGLQHQTVQQTSFQNTQQPSISQPNQQQQQPQQSQSSQTTLQQSVPPQAIPQCVQQQQQMPQIQQSLQQQHPIQTSLQQSQPLPKSGSLQQPNQSTPPMQPTLPQSVLHSSVQQQQQSQPQQVQPTSSVNGTSQGIQQSYTTTQINDQNIPSSASQGSAYQLDVMLPSNINQSDVLITPNQVPPNQYPLSQLQQPQSMSVPTQIPLHVSIHQPYQNTSSNYVNASNINLTSTSISSQATPPISQQQFFSHAVSQSVPPLYSSSQTSCSVSSQDMQHLCMHPHQIMSSISQQPLISSVSSQTMQSAVQTGNQPQQQQHPTQSLNLNLGHQSQIPYSVPSQNMYSQNGVTSQTSANAHTQTAPISQSCTTTGLPVQQYVSIQPSVLSLTSAPVPVTTGYVSNLNVLHHSSQLPQHNYIQNVVAGPQMYSGAIHNPCNITFSDTISTEPHNVPSSHFPENVAENARNNEEVFLQRSVEDVDSTASGSNAVAIDNKIEQAMDLVKSHLMFAVREEVEVLKEKIAELMDRINQLEIENSILKSNASQETIDLLPKLSSASVAVTNAPGSQAPCGPTNGQPP